MVKETTVSSNSSLRCASFFAGVGGIDLGFSQAGFDIVYANEIDRYAADTYELNSAICVDCRDICEVSASEIPDFDAMLAGFPCQPFSVAGYRQGFDDEKGRGNMFFQLTRLIREKKSLGYQPSICFFENVKNLVNHDNGNTFKVICKELNELGYQVKHKVMNASEYGNLPQNRERVYIVAFLDKDAYTAFEFPEKMPLTCRLADVIGISDKVDKKYYYTEKRCPFYEQLKKDVVSQDTVYQWRRAYVRGNKNGLIPTLTANMGSGGHNVPIILSDRGEYRKITPKECFNAQGYPQAFKLPNQSNCRLYKQAGNSVAVPVIRRTAEAILKAENA